MTKNLFRQITGNFKFLFFFLSVLNVASCTMEEKMESEHLSGLNAMPETIFTSDIDLMNLPNYSNQRTPPYIRKDNTAGNDISDAGATLGRVLFYDKNLSVNNTVSCASCHKQAFAFGDTVRLSRGVNGVTGRHAPRLANARFADERRFFWDERANTLEEQTTQPIQDHIEMGFSGQNGNPDFNDLIRKLESLNYYNELFSLTFGDPEITETRMQNALAQFVRSIQSFDSKFDEGLALVDNLNEDFPNFTAEENLGKSLFLTPPNGGPDGRPGTPGANVRGAGCQGCHRAPEFDIDPNSRNNGVISVANNPEAIDLNNTRSPSLRDLVNSEGVLNGPLMHDGVFRGLNQVINHYNNIPNRRDNTNLDPRLGRGPATQNLRLSPPERDALVAFLRTLSGRSIYTDPKFSDPFRPEN